ncbi:ABC transporter substrate-binding protein [Cohnella abietis]|uniref:ABC transporter substrate-binding protein n=1 Tax=Cohnella abietis TaxID=2507935 RepID=A0A3T1D7R8_9BACL|nr:ABC transporter substrate-binding protein [Cohnella abietis]BBI34130.1 ABC transporter substrate-binding protein [Cohnella abietis]
MLKLFSRKTIVTLSMLILLSQVLAACGKDNNTSPATPSETSSATASESPSSSASTEPEKPIELTKITQALDWFPGSTHAGFYAAQSQGFYKDENLEVSIEAGGPQVSAIQIVASGKANFGVESADALLLAREQGIPVVGLAATLQKAPNALFFHKGANIKDFADLNGHTVQAALTSPYWTYLKDAYKLDKVKEMQYNGQYANFLNDKNAVIQGYATSDVYTFEKQNVDVDHLLVADSGYEPYYTIIFTTESYLKEHPEVVKAYLKASAKGWNYFKDNVGEVDKVLAENIQDAKLDELDYSGNALKDFIFGGDAATNGFGYMSNERWTKLYDQLRQLNVLKKDLDVNQVFTTEYLPK